MTASYERAQRATNPKKAPNESSLSLSYSVGLFYSYLVPTFKQIRNPLI